MVCDNRKKLKELPWCPDMLLILLFIGNIVTALNLPYSAPVAPFATGGDRIECFPFSKFTATYHSHHRSS